MKRKVNLFSITILPGFLFFAVFASIVKPQSVLSDEGKARLLHRKAYKTLSEKQYVKAVKIYDELLKNYPDYRDILSVYYELIPAYEQLGNLEKLAVLYEHILSVTSEAEEIADIQNKLYALNIQLLFSPAMTSRSFQYQVVPGDSLSKIAKKYNTTVDLLKKSNRLKSDLIRIGQKLKVSQISFNIFIDKSLNKLLLKSGDKIFKTYDISTGLNNSTPTGKYEIVNKLVNPTWYSVDAVVPPGSPKNILGTRWMGLSLPSYGIHGTTDPDSIGEQNTAGCVRLLNADVEELYTILPIGVEVTIID